jgi:hypothetical protein
MGWWCVDRRCGLVWSGVVWSGVDWRGLALVCVGVVWCGGGVRCRGVRSGCVEVCVGVGCA